ncbi:MAG: hypothetical protein MJZ37_08860 [Bacilli bacterium]|nr:hypothetical protein [Bacilli bacterium]
MSKDKKQFYGSRSAADVYRNTVHMLNNKYYNIYRSNFKTKGLTYREEQYVMNRFWEAGTVAAFNIKHTDALGYAQWAMNTWDMYGEPEQVNLINKYGSPLVPSGIQVVDKDVVIGYIQSNRKPLNMIVNWYVERIAQIQMVINTNLELHKMPFIIPVGDDSEKKKIMDVVDKILNNEIVIAVEGVEPNIFKAISTQVPYIIDKLENHMKNLENDLLTYLGVNNSGSNKVEQVQLSEVNSNNEEINLSDDNFNDNLKQFCRRVKEVLGKDISIEVSGQDAQADGQVHENDEKTGPKDDGEDE